MHLGESYVILNVVRVDDVPSIRAHAIVLVESEAGSEWLVFMDFLASKLISLLQQRGKLELNFQYFVRQEKDLKV